MIITPYFVWTHLAKTGGYSVHKIFGLVKDDGLEMDPIGGEWSDYRRHEPFWLRSQKCGYDISAGKMKILSIRRLPSWMLSFAEFKKREEGFDFTIEELTAGYFKHEKRDMHSGKLSDKGTYETHHADEALAYYQPEIIDRWWKQESLYKDVIDTLKEFYPISNGQKEQMRAFHENANNYNRQVEERFTLQQLEELYHNCPLWTNYELKVYGSLLA